MVPKCQFGRQCYGFRCPCELKSVGVMLLWSQNGARTHTQYLTITFFRFLSYTLTC